MCSPSKPEPVPLPPTPPDFQSEQAAIATTVQNENQKRLFAGLSSTIAGAASGVLKGSTLTTRGYK